MDESTRSIVALEGMQDIPLPGMETLNETSPKISEQVENENENENENDRFVYRIVDDLDQPYGSNRNNCGVYDTLEGVKKAFPQVQRQVFWNRDPQTGTYVKYRKAKGWKIQASKVVWYDLS